MLKASPQHTGTVLKLRVSPIYTMLPHIVQKWILTLWCFKCLRPHWQSRHLVLLGSYLYKFANNNESSTEPKGAPLHIEGVDAHVIDSDFDLGIAVHALPPGYTTVIAVSTLRKKQYYACPSREDAIAWINSLREARHEAVTRYMGHAATDSYPSQWAYYDTLGRRLAQSKDRIRRRMEERARGEVEMGSLTDGGPAPRGYYG